MDTLLLMFFCILFSFLRKEQLKFLSRICHASKDWTLCYSCYREQIGSTRSFLPFVKGMPKRVKILFYLIGQSLFVFLLSKLVVSFGYVFMEDLQRAVDQFMTSGSGGGGSAPLPGSPAPGGSSGIKNSFSWFFENNNSPGDEVTSNSRASEAGPSGVAEPANPPTCPAETASLKRELIQLITDQVRKESERGVGPLSRFPEQRRVYSEVANYLMNELEISTEDPENMKEWIGILKNQNNNIILKDFKRIMKEYLPSK